MSIDRSSDFLQSFAEQSINGARTLANRIGSFVPSRTNVDFSYTATKPNINRPVEIGDLLGEENNAAAISMLNAETDKWLDKYFPNLNSCTKYQPEEWACGILTGQKPFGLSREVFDAVWHEGRDRAHRTAGTERSQIAADYSLRGFSMPQGAMQAAYRNAEIRASDSIAEINRAQTVRDAEIKLELVKFAATTAAQIKTGMMQILANFYSQWVSLANKDSQDARNKVQAYSAFTQSLSSYYNVELGFEELRLKAAQAKSGAQEVQAKLSMQEGEVRASQNAALAQAARGFADAAGAAANAQSSLQAELFSGQL